MQETNRSKQLSLPAALGGCFLSLLFDPDGGDTFFHNDAWHYNPENQTLLSYCVKLRSYDKFVR
jgi:hypothetical protein